jgi:hypothetical protein
MTEDTNIQEIPKSGEEFTEFTATNGRFIKSAFKRQALRVSEVTRQGKFTRVSQEFIDNCIAEVEAKMASLAAPVNPAPYGQVDTDGIDFLTGAGKKRLVEQFNIWIARAIHRQANNVRVGKTL